MYVSKRGRNVRRPPRTPGHHLVEPQNQRLGPHCHVHRQVGVARRAGDDAAIVDLQVAPQLVDGAAEVVDDGEGRHAARADCVGGIAPEVLHRPARECGAVVGPRLELRGRERRRRRRPEEK